MADAPVATFLSGGLDSSIVTALAHRRNPAIEAYTIAFRPEDQRLESMPDDAKYARRLAAHLGIQLHEIEIDPNIVEMLPRMVDILDEPIGDPAAINTLLMCDAARDAGVKVLLSGMGADELFGGYRKHLAMLVAQRYQGLPGPVRGVVGPAVRALPVAVAGRGLRTVRWGQRFLTFAELPEQEAFRRSYTLYDRDEIVDLLDPALTRSVDTVIDRHRQVYEDTALDDVVSRMCLADTRMFMQGLNLTYTDRASMAASTEVRVPFVDPVVMAAAFSLPGSRRSGGASRRPRSKTRPARGCPARSSTVPRRASVRRCVPGSPTTSGSWWTTSSSPATWWAAASCARSRSGASSPTSAADVVTSRSRSGSCSASSSGTATPAPEGSRRHDITETPAAQGCRGVDSRRSST